jgi:hypothetical protein
MKIKKLSTLIFRLKVLNVICSESTVFIVTLCMFLIPTLIIWGVDLFSCLFVLLCHFLIYNFIFRKMYREILPEKKKIENAIFSLKKRRIERQ